MSSAQKLSSARRVIDSIGAASTFAEAQELIARASSELRSAREKLLAEAVQMHSGKRNAQALKKKAREWAQGKTAYYDSDDLMQWVFHLRNEDQHGSSGDPATGIVGSTTTGSMYFESLG